MQGTIKVLDCTLRDGGRELEDLSRNGFKMGFSREDRRKIADCMAGAGIDIIELGSIAETDMDLEKFAIYQNIESLSEHMPQKRKEGQIFAGFYIGPDTEPDKIPEYSPELCDGARVCLRYTELTKSLAYCAALSRKGYKVFIQPMVTMRYSDTELERIVHTANEIGAYALYFVDSYGYMNEKQIERIFRLYDDKLDPAVRIGFHPHNNMDMAFGNARYFIRQAAGRDIIVDSCAAGMGQGAGNLQTELLADYINADFGGNYRFEEILEACDTVGKFCPAETEAWGYSPVKLISAVHKTAYKYAVALRLQHHMSLAAINHLLSDMPDDIRHRYTQESLLNLLSGKAGNDR